ncbi:hypothetical protein C3492_05405 [Streptomyces sp. Ru62]|uniref:tyrosine-protein phosphatase n=1 Tax=Streptomyces sp. Ru62 TaxID=2080745 RepID=UPI000CDCEF0A|nr:tyrosine-protein phosphatase [Streptomyces sp. Ru62]POX64470.1 hypothetical protein C3492_05405 [Streptomyces sp. Ru62]
MSPQHSDGWRPGVNLREVRGSGLVPGRLFRSGDLTALTVHDADRLVAEHGLRTVVDLRSEGELARYGPPYTLLRAGVRWVRAPLTGHPGTAIEAPRPTDAQRAEYLDAILRDSAPWCWPRLGAALAGCLHEPTLVSCHFGKDRTGVVVASLLAVAGVSEEETAADFAAGADDLLDKAHRFEDTRVRYGHTPEDFRLRLATDPGPLRLWLAAVGRRHQGLPEALLARGVSGGDLAAIRAALRADGGPEQGSEQRRTTEKGAHR